MGIRRSSADSCAASAESSADRSRMAEHGGCQRGYSLRPAFSTTRERVSSGAFPRRPWVMYVGGVIAIGSLAFFVYIVPSLNARAADDVGISGGCLAAGVHHPLEKAIPPEHTFGLRLTGSLFALNAATHVARAVYYASGAAAERRAHVVRRQRRYSSWRVSAAIGPPSNWLHVPCGRASRCRFE